MNGQKGRRSDLRGDPLGTKNDILCVRIQHTNIDRLAGGSVLNLPRKVHLFL